MALNPDQGETVGWPRFADTVARAWRSIPPAERRRTAIFTSNYGEAGAVDLLGRSRGLPRAYSGHNGFSEWGRPPDTDTNALLLGYDAAADAAPYFTGCRPLATDRQRGRPRQRRAGRPCAALPDDRTVVQAVAEAPAL